MNILLGVTGSVASTLTGKLALALRKLGHVKIVITESAKPFFKKDTLKETSYGTSSEGPQSRSYLHVPNGEFYQGAKGLKEKKSAFTVLTDKDEWTWSEQYKYIEGPYLNYTLKYPHLEVVKPEQKIHTARRDRTLYLKDDPVLHIELRKWADVLVIAPLSANTLAKMTYGLCDNLLTSIYRAWDWRKPVVVAPSMNTMMWENDPTSDQLGKLRNRSVIVVPPMEKELACGDIGEGAMALIDDIVKATKEELVWRFPLDNYRGIPVNNHPGAFGFRRKKCHHSGVDLYTDEGANIYAVEAGRVVGIEHFTGPQDSTPWYENTEAILIEGKTGVVCYGEMIPRGYKPTSFASAMNRIAVGDWVKKGGYIGRVTPVIPVGREQAYPGWSRSMLHLELYKHGTHECSHRWHLDAEMHPYLIDPTPFLREALAITGVDESSYLLNYDG